MCLALESARSRFASGTMCGKGEEERDAGVGLSAGLEFDPNDVKDDREESEDVETVASNFSSVNAILNASSGRVPNSAFCSGVR